MKSIDITEERRTKLLEMCKVLFPEYTIQLNINGLEYGTFIVLNNGENIIHWFEFCMTFLVNKIYYPDNNGKRDTRQKIEYFFFQTFIDTIEGATSGYKHPVDYLYKEFLKLK